ncbi:MAG TPA: hypothetical protein VIK75_08835, partial [Calditerricola sp.]
MKQWWRTLSLKWKLSSSIALIILFTVLLYTACFGYLFYRFADNVNAYLADSQSKMQSMSNTTKETLLNNLKLTSTSVNQGFTLFLQQMESLAHFLAQS